MCRWSCSSRCYSDIVAFRDETTWCDLMFCRDSAIKERPIFERLQVDTGTFLFPWLSFMLTWSWRSLWGAGGAVAEGGWCFKFAPHSSDEEPPIVLHSGIKVPLNSLWSPACSAGVHLLPLTFELQHVCSSALKVGAYKAVIYTQNFKSIRTVVVLQNSPV